MYTLLYIKYITGDRRNIYNLIYVYRNIKQIKVKTCCGHSRGLEVSWWVGDGGRGERPSPRPLAPSLPFPQASWPLSHFSQTLGRLVRAAGRNALIHRTCVESPPCARHCAQC